MILEIIKYPHKILRAKCESVEFPLTNEIEQLCNGLKETCAHHNGLGLAAPQVGYDLRIFVIGESTYINPIIISGSRKIWSEESCLSLPNQKYKVRRYEKISVAYYNLFGEIINDKIFNGLESIIFQHEFDHLKGILILDKEIK
jgi:peptide deformylase